MQTTQRPTFLPAGLLGVALAISGCQGAAPSAAGFTPLSSSDARGGGPSAARPKQILYATTLDWNTGTGSVYYYDAYGKNTSALGSLAISPGFPDGVWTDRKGNVYVAVVNSSANGRGYINVYTPEFGKLLGTYTAGLDGPSGGTFDAAGTMYVSNLCGMASTSCYVFAKPRHGRRDQGGSTSGYVAVYPSGRTQPSKYLEMPINIAVGVAVDASGNVFVPNNTGGYAWNVVEFPAGASQGKFVPLRGMPKNLWVGAATFDATGALVISANSAIDFFPHEKGRPARELTNGVVAADGLAYGPDSTLFAGNYEFENNEGNIIVFPPGATKPARSFSVPYNNGVVSVAVGRASSR
jgi:hypothetical protein